MASRKIEITVDEVIALLKKTSLPTIIVEGNDDMVVYRTFEQKLSYLSVSVLPVGGRTKVLEIFSRRSEFSNFIQPIFIADKDTWAFTGIPNAYQSDNLIFTHGYSIENDIYVDGELRNLLVANEMQRYSEELEEFITWYALAVSRHLIDSKAPIALHPEHVLDPFQRPALIALNVNESYPTALKDKISQDYRYLVRGKSLIALLIRNLNYRALESRHHSTALLETTAIRPGAHLNILFEKISDYFSSIVTTPSSPAPQTPS